MLDKKHIQAILLLEFKTGGKAVETTHNINNTFSPRTANEHTVQWWFKKSCKGDKNLDDEENSGWPSEVDNDQLRGSSKLYLLHLPEKLQNNSVSTILLLPGIWSKLERWKSSISGCLVSWQQMKNDMILKCCLFFYATRNHLLIELSRVMKSGIATAASDDQLSGWAEKKLKSIS